MRLVLLAATLRATSAALALPSVLTTRGHNATAYVVTAAPGGSGLSFPLGTGPTNAPLMTELVRSVSSTIRARGGQLGVRVCTTRPLL